MEPAAVVTVTVSEASEAWPTGAAILLLLLGLALVAAGLLSPSPFVWRGALAQVADERGELFAGGIALLVGLVVAILLSAVG